MHHMVDEQHNTANIVIDADIMMSNGYVVKTALASSPQVVRRIYMYNYPALISEL